MRVWDSVYEAVAISWKQYTHTKHGKKSVQMFCLFIVCQHESGGSRNKQFTTTLCSIERMAKASLNTLDKNTKNVASEPNDSYLFLSISVCLSHSLIRKAVENELIQRWLIYLKHSPPS